MNIVYSASDLYASLAGISITSLLMNNTDAPEICIIILDNGIGEANREKLCKTVEKFGREIRFIPLTQILKNVSFDLKRWNISTFGRLFEASSLPDLDKVIHIDCDTIVDGSLKELWETDVEHHVLAAAPECIGDAYKTNIGMAAEEMYIQAGVILLNLKRIRQLELEKKFVSYLEQNGENLMFVDQEIINACVPASEKLELPVRYNSYTQIHLLSYRQVRQFKHAKHMISESNYHDALSNAVIYHYTWCVLEGTRPWVEGDRHPKRDRFLHYQAQSQWVDMQPWPDSRKPWKRLFISCVNLAPKWLMTTAAGYVHGIFLPWRNRIKRKNTQKVRG